MITCDKPLFASSPHRILSPQKFKFGFYNCIYIGTKVKWSHYRPGVAQTVGRGIALLFHDRGTRRGCVVSSTPRPHFTPLERPSTHFTGGWWAPRPVWMGRKSRPHRNSIPDRPASRLSYPAYNRNEYQEYFLGNKGGRGVWLTNLPPSCVDCP